MASLEPASPQSLEITHALLARGGQHTLRECLDTEFALTRTTIRTPDFLEGVRAGLVDKDRSPVWQRASRGGPRCRPDFGDWVYFSILSC
ncbi:enoyl-CoA hydratase/isomerase family protein [Actinoallomurus sp. CA-150999]|uniref:enoyl-CoA hydratase/isomerase family protein n=1 Tax=Actinoallomurus sp. CA-150999 TaxID=3239887 RepID=UPI003D910DD2